MHHLVNRNAIQYYHKITEYGIKCCMHAHLEAPRAPPSRGELYRRKTLFLDNFPIFFLSKWDLDPPHPPTSKLFLDFWKKINFTKPLIHVGFICGNCGDRRIHEHRLSTTFRNGRTTMLLVIHPGVNSSKASTPSLAGVNGWNQSTQAAI